jgi:PAS domain S-box-containing protein
MDSSNELSFDQAAAGLTQVFLEHAPAAVAMFDREMRYLAFSRRWVQDYGLGGRDLLGCSHYDIFPEIPPFWKEVHQRGMGGEVVRAEQDRFQRQDGSVQYLRWQVRPWLNSAGTVGGIIIFSEDISETTRMAEELREINTQLERRVTERTAELQAANRELDSFAYAVSHDLRSPLRAMGGFSRALLEDFGDALPPEAIAYLDQIEIGSRRMGDLVEGILTLSRCTRGELIREWVDVSALSRVLIAELALVDPARQVAAEIEPGLRTSGDPRMIEVVLRNLLGNAWKYTSRCPEARIRVHAGTDQDLAWICVSDNGCGFKMAHAARLFQPFQRLHRQDEYPGMGIGLATVQRIVERHGGLLRAQAELGAGATLMFSLPAQGVEEP